MGKMKERLIPEVDLFEAVYKAGYMDDDGDIDHDKMSRDKVWATKYGELYSYEDITDEHLNRILAMFNEGRFDDTPRMCHYRGLVQELFRRTGFSGEVLYGRTNKKSF